jgi:hypothetical protein
MDVSVDAAAQTVIYVVTATMFYALAIFAEIFP